MRARVTNMSRGARGFHTEAGTVLLDPGASAVLALAPHPVHEAWAAAGEIGVTPEEEPDAATSRARPTTRAGAARSRDA